MPPPVCHASNLRASGRPSLARGAGARATATPKGVKKGEAAQSGRGRSTAPRCVAEARGAEVSICTLPAPWLWLCMSCVDDRRRIWLGGVAKRYWAAVGVISDGIKADRAVVGVKFPVTSPVPKKLGAALAVACTRPAAASQVLALAGCCPLPLGKEVLLLERVPLAASDIRSSAANSGWDSCQAPLPSSASPCTLELLADTASSARPL